MQSTDSEGEVDAEFASEDEAYSALSRNRERLGSRDVVLSMLPPARGDEYHAYGDSVPGPGYGRREREISRGLPSSAGRSAAYSTDRLYPSSRYY